MGSAARWRNASAHHRSSKGGYKKNEHEKTTAKGQLALPNTSLATRRNHDQWPPASCTTSCTYTARKRCHKAPAKPRAAAREAGGTSPFPWCRFLQRCTFGWLLARSEFKRSATNAPHMQCIACLQCSVHAAGHCRCLSSICEAWELG